jgi:hypothetical protein
MSRRSAPSCPPPPGSARLAEPVNIHRRLHPARRPRPRPDVRHRHHPGRGCTSTRMPSASSTSPGGPTSRTPTSLTPTPRAPGRPAVVRGDTPASPACSGAPWPDRYPWWSPRRRTGRPCPAWSARGWQRGAQVRRHLLRQHLQRRHRQRQPRLPAPARPGLADGFAEILAGCATLLKPGGVVVVVTARRGANAAN